ncbi:MAG: thiopeptide-type bacteriocin biosynthesis protein [Bacteroidales bacterium]
MVKRSFVLGEEWIYYKFYTGKKTADKILAEAIKPAVDYLLDTKQVDQWFFIRYVDPDWHLRVRLHLTNANGIGTVIQTIYKYIERFVEQELIWKVQADTYQRELERYGVSTMELSEQLFFHSSELILSALPFFKDQKGETLRWLFALMQVDSLLNSFNYTLSDKLRLLQGLKDAFGNEFGMNHFLKSQLDAKYRKQRNLIEQTLSNSREKEPATLRLIEVINANDEFINRIAQRILHHHQNNSLEIPLDSLLSSYIHMLMNRTFRSKQRLHELVIYDFLFRFYTSEIAKEKYRTSSLPGKTVSTQ